MSAKWEITSTFEETEKDADPPKVAILEHDKAEKRHPAGARTWRTHGSQAGSLQGSR